MSKKITYNQGSDPDKIVKNTSRDEVLDLDVLSQKYDQIKSRLGDLPGEKKQPDQETLDVYNNHISQVRILEIHKIKSEAKLLYDDMIQIHQAGLLPPKYDQLLVELNEVINS